MNDARVWNVQSKHMLGRLMVLDGQVGPVFRDKDGDFLEIKEAAQALLSGHVDLLARHCRLPGQALLFRSVLWRKNS